jgi:hypothetical protein
MILELTNLVGHEIPTVSRHLSLLKFYGTIEDEKRGAQVFYRLKRRCVMEFFGCIALLQAGEDCESAVARPQPTSL